MGREGEIEIGWEGREMVKKMGMKGSIGSFLGDKKQKSFQEVLQWLSGKICCCPVCPVAIFLSSKDAFLILHIWDKSTLADA